MEIDYKILETYTPNSDIYTSVDEINYITEKLIKGNSLNNFDITDLQKIRNEVVRFYSEKENSMSSMQSVTAVIDMYIYSK